MESKAFMILATLLFASSAVYADVVINLSLAANTAQQTWQAFAAVEDPDDLVDGIASMRISVAGTNGLDVISSKNETPNPTETSDFMLFNTKGFNLLRSNGSNGFHIEGSQNTIANSVLPSGQDDLIRGVGEYLSVVTNGLLPDFIVTHPDLIASGAYQGTGVLSVTGNTLSVSMLPEPTPFGVSFSTKFPDVVNDSSLLIPEPGTILFLSAWLLYSIRTRNECEVLQLRI